MEVDAEDVRYFHLLAQVGTLVRAGAELGVDHTTVSRRVQRLERALGMRLFSRTPNGWAINSNGERLLPAARMVALGADAFTSGGSSVGGSEEWTILSPDGFAASVLTPRCVKVISEQSVIIRIVSAPSLASRDGGSFDVAIVRSRPTSSTVRSRPLADYEIGLYAREDYLAKSTPIREIGDLEGHALAWYTEDPIASVPEYQILRPQLPQHILIQSNNLNVHEQAALSGDCMAIMPTYTAARNDSLIRILPDQIRYHGRYWTVVPTTQLRATTTERVMAFLTEAVEEAGLTTVEE